MTRRETKKIESAARWLQAELLTQYGHVTVKEAVDLMGEAAYRMEACSPFPVHGPQAAAELALKDWEAGDGRTTSVECSECEVVVAPDDQFFATLCGTFCEDHMLDHVRCCGVCRYDFF